MTLMPNVRNNFSVIMCVYHGDNGKYFEKAFDSILNQTVKSNDIVIIVDGWVREDVEIVLRKIEKYSFVRIIRLDENKGHAKARNEGLLRAKYDVIALMDADDISLPYRFEEQLKKIYDGYDVVGGQIEEFIGSENNIIGKRNVPVEHNEIIKYMKLRCPFNQVTIMFKKKSVELSGMYVDVFCNEDYFLWIRMYLCGCKFANLNKVLCRVRVGKDLYERRGGWKYFKSEAYVQKFMLIRKIIGFNLFVFNIFVRFLIQVCMNGYMRSAFYKMLRK